MRRREPASASCDVAGLAHQTEDSGDDALNDVVVRAEYQEENRMIITAAHLSPVLSIVFGILILIVPRFLNYLVAIYLILAGLLGLGILR